MKDDCLSEYLIFTRSYILYLRSKKIKQTSKISDKPERIPLVEATIDGTLFVLINTYNANTDLEQLETLSDLLNIFGEVKFTQNKNIVLGGDFNLIFDISIESFEGNLCLQKKSFTKLIQINKIFNSCDIWRIQNSKMTFSKNNIYQH